MDSKKKKDFTLRKTVAIQDGYFKKKASKPTQPKMNWNSPSSKTPPSTEPSVPSEMLADFFECPICLDYALPPIYQCHSGHLICSICRPKCETVHDNSENSPLCPTCRQPLETIRNMALERMSGLIPFPCKFSTFGCPSKLSPSEKLEHEKACHFKIIRCPVPKSSRCEWEGNANKVLAHISGNHKEVTTLHGSDIIFMAADVLTPAPAEWLMMQETYGKTFLIVLKKVKHENVVTFYAYTVALGLHEEAKKFAYRVALNDDDKRLSWEAIPKSIIDECSVWESECLKIDNETVIMFAKNNDLALNVKGEYSSEAESEDSCGQ